MKFNNSLRESTDNIMMGRNNTIVMITHLITTNR